MIEELEGQGIPQRSLLGHLGRSTLAGAISGTAVVALGALVGPARTSQSAGRGIRDVAEFIAVPTLYALVAGTVIGLVAGLATLRHRGRFDASLRHRTARILGLVVALPGGLLLWVFWLVSTASTVVFVLTMLASVLYVGFGTYLTAKASLLFVLGAAPRSDNGARRNVGLTFGP